MDQPLFESAGLPGESTLARPQRRAASVAAPWLLRGALLAGCVLAAIIAVTIADPASYIDADRALARLLRGMALIKGSAVLATVAALLWRFGHRVTTTAAVGYCVSAWAMTATTVLIWQLTRIPVAAVVFHAALISLLVMAWRDDNNGLRTRFNPPI